MDRRAVDLAVEAEPGRGVAYRLPDGREIPIRAELCRWEPTCGFTLRSGEVVDAVRVEAFPPAFGAGLAEELQRVTWYPSTRKLWDGTKNVVAAPPDWLTFAPLVANLAGLPLGGGRKALAGAVAVVPSRVRGVERWAVVAVRGAGGIEWAIACLGAA